MLDIRTDKRLIFESLYESFGQKHIELVDRIDQHLMSVACFTTREDAEALAALAGCSGTTSEYMSFCAGYAVLKHACEDNDNGFSFDFDLVKFLVDAAGTITAGYVASAHAAALWMFDALTLSTIPDFDIKSGRVLLSDIEGSELHHFLKSTVGILRSAVSIAKHVHSTRRAQMLESVKLAVQTVAKSRSDRFDEDSSSLFTGISVGQLTQMSARTHRGMQTGALRIIGGGAGGGKSHWVASQMQKHVVTHSATHSCHICEMESVAQSKVEGGRKVFIIDSLGDMASSPRIGAELKRIVEDEDREPFFPKPKAVIPPKGRQPPPLKGRKHRYHN